VVVTTQEPATLPTAPITERRRLLLGCVALRSATLHGGTTVIDGADRLGVDALRLLMVRSGRVTVVRPRATPVALDAGGAMFTGRGLAYRADGPEAEIVSTTVPVADLPAPLRRLIDLPIRPLAPSALVDAVVRTTATLLDRADEPMGFDPVYAAHGLINLQAALLVQLLGQAESSGPDLTYRRAVAFIEQHLADPDLRPPRIAFELGVSVRYLHLAFAQRDSSVARHVKRRRVERVTAELAEGVPIAELAPRFGFPSTEALTRVLRESGG
jgi:AraC-like DNA-binding protein